MSNPILVQDSSIQGLPRFANPQVSEVEYSPWVTLSASSDYTYQHKFGTGNNEKITVKGQLKSTNGTFGDTGDIMVESLGLDLSSAARGLTVYIAANQTHVGVRSAATGVVVTTDTGSNSTMGYSEFQFRFVIEKTTIGDIITSLDTMAMVPLLNINESNVADYELNLSQFYNKYSRFMLSVDKFVPATDAVRTAFTVSDDGGVTYESSSYYFAINGYSMAGGTASGGTSGQTTFSIEADTIGSAANETHSFKMDLMNPKSATEYFKAMTQFSMTNSSGNVQALYGVAGFNGNTNQVTNIKFALNSGNIETMQGTLYGLQGAA